MTPPQASEAAVGVTYNVLAVLERATAAMQFERDDHKYHRPDIAGWWDRLLIDTNEARAAVADLVEAARDVERRAGPDREPRLRAALARVLNQAPTP